MPRQFGKQDISTGWPTCPNCPHRHQPDVRCPVTGVWLVRGTATGRPGVVWIKKPMPDGQWPPGLRAPRDDSFSWWVRSHCGHQGGAKQWAFYDESYADMYEHLFRDDPCWWTECPDFKIKKDRRMSRG
jgi:hypothetical protein